MSCLATVLKEIEELAGESCVCEDPEVDPRQNKCRSCEATHLLNEIGEEMRYGLGRLREFYGG